MPSGSCLQLVPSEGTGQTAKFMTYQSLWGGTRNHTWVLPPMLQPLHSWDKCWGPAHEAIAPLVLSFSRGLGEVTWMFGDLCT